MFKNDKLNFIVILFIILLIIFLNNTTSPTNFATEKILTIESGQSIKSTADFLKREGIIRSKMIFNSVIILKGEHVVEGTYLFHNPENIFQIIDKVTTGNYEIPTIKITFFEGETSYEMAKKLKNKLPNFDVNKFSELAKINEGYLFPDTYEFPSNVSVDEVITTLRDNFDKKIDNISDLIENSNRELDEIIKMASIIEKESDLENMQKISNVLWKRYDLEIPLQVDATFVYSIGKNSFNLTREELKDRENPYNSYEFVGLPPTPISNPGIQAIKAATNQQETSYLFFLTGRNGITYYANNFEQHKNNRALYLD